MLYGERWEKVWWEMGDSGVGDGRRYPHVHPLIYLQTMSVKSVKKTIMALQ